MNRLMNSLVFLAAIFLAWTALHMIAAERERCLDDLQARRAADAAAVDHKRRLAQQPILVR